MTCWSLKALLSSRPTRTSRFALSLSLTHTLTLYHTLSLTLSHSLTLFHALLLSHNITLSHTLHPGDQGEVDAVVGAPSSAVDNAMISPSWRHH